MDIETKNSLRRFFNLAKVEDEASSIVKMRLICPTRNADKTVLKMVLEYKR